MIARCPRRVHWLDLDATVPCIRDRGHDGDHTDGDRWFDDYGIQTPQDRPARRALEPIEPIRPTRRRDPRARLTDKQAAEIRRRHDAGETKTAIARDLDVNYSTVWSIANRMTYRSAG